MSSLMKIRNRSAIFSFYNPTISQKATRIWTEGYILVLLRKLLFVYVTFSTELSDDRLRDFSIEAVESNGLVCLPYLDHRRPTTRKNGFRTAGQRMLQVDRCDNRPISERPLG